MNFLPSYLYCIKINLDITLFLPSLVKKVIKMCWYSKYKSTSVRFPAAKQLLLSLFPIDSIAPTALQSLINIFCVINPKCGGTSAVRNNIFSVMNFLTKYI